MGARIKLPSVIIATSETSCGTSENLQNCQVGKWSPEYGML